MNLDLEKPTIAQLKGLINNINNVFHEDKMEKDLPSFAQLKLKHIKNGQYTLTAQMLDSESFKIINEKLLSSGNRYDLTNYVFNRFYTAKEVA